MRSDVTYKKYVKTKHGKQGVRDVTSDLVSNNPGIELLADNGNKDLVNYIEWLNLDKDPNLVVLSSVHHYFYDVEEMKNVKTVVNLMPVNQVRDTRSFFHSVYTILRPKSNFIGNFIDSKTHNGFSLKSNHEDAEAVGNGILSRIPFLNTIYNLMDSKHNKLLSRNSITLLLGNHGFMVMDMTELNGITYFHAKKV